MSLAGRFSDHLTWLRRSSSLRLSLLLSGVFAIGMTVAIFVALTLGEDALERRIDRSLEELARASSLQDTRGDTFSMIIRAPTDLDDLPGAFTRAAQHGGGVVDLDRDFRRSDTWRVLLTEDSRGAPVLIAVPLDDSEEALELLAGILWTTGLVVVGAARRAIRVIPRSGTTQSTHHRTTQSR